MPISAPTELTEFFWHISCRKKITSLLSASHTPVLAPGAYIPICPLLAATLRYVRRLLTYGSRKSWIITTHIHVHKIHLRHIVITNKIESLKISIWYKGFKKTSCPCMTSWIQFSRSRTGDELSCTMIPMSLCCLFWTTVYSWRQQQQQHVAAYGQPVCRVQITRINVDVGQCHVTLLTLLFLLTYLLQRPTVTTKHLYR